MDEGLKKLRATRGYIKSSLSRLYTFVGQPEMLTECSLEELKGRYERLVSVFKQYELTNYDILTLNPLDEEDVDTVESKYFYVSSVLKEEINKRSTSSGPDNTSSHPVSSSGRVKLPEIYIPTFEGKYCEYVTFMSLFRSVIHSDRSLDNIQRLHYLRSFLRGEPHEIVKNLALTVESYDEALRLLDDRYFNKHRIVSDHINSLLDLNAIVKSNPQPLREFVCLIKQTLSALQNLEANVSAWDPILMCILIRKLDTYTSRAYQMERNPTEEPSVAKLLTFIEKRALAMENSGSTSKVQSVPPRVCSNVAAAVPRAKKPKQCDMCKSSDHMIYLCSKFKMAPIAERLAVVKDMGLCHICLNIHTGKCRYHFRCVQCKGDHNTLIHQDEQSTPVTLLSGSSDATNVLLPTARVKLIASDKREVHIKAILDSASQVSLVTQKVVDILGVAPVQNRTQIIGVTNAQNNVQYSVPLEVHSLTSSFKTGINCHVVDQITCRLPQSKLDIATIQIPPNIRLADADYNTPSDIHMLIGADVFFQILLPLEKPVSVVQASLQSSSQQQDKVSVGQQHSSSVPCSEVKSPCIINTQFGHVIAGALTQHAQVSKVVSLLCMQCNSDVNVALKKFWETECVPEIFNEKSTEQDIAEANFQSTVKLNNNRFQVDLPLKVLPSQVNDKLGNSFDLALYRFLNLEKKLHKNTKLLTEYTKFIDEYIELGHGHYVDVTSYDLGRDPVYFLPHHAVFNEESITTKTRVVFDASMKTNKKISLNDILLNGPQVQRDLFDIMILFRLGDYTFTTDIRRMFRNVEVNPLHTSLQNILWREDPNVPIKCIRLDTVTYGLKCSSYLATRCLLELVNRHESEFPLASFIIKNCVYVDDVIYSNSDKGILIQAKNELCTLLSLGGFFTHKWSSNCTDVIADIPASKQAMDELDLQKESYSMKALGLNIDVRKDCFVIKSPDINNLNIITKRDILSCIARFYDPMGFVSPIIVKAKVIMQRLWSVQAAWSTAVPEEIKQEWVQFTNSLYAMEPIYLSRNIPISDNVSEVQLIGFADASSTTGYGCCVYLRVVHSSGKVYMYLLCSKSRINPHAKPLTIPRLELNAALLLATLIIKVNRAVALKQRINDVYLFSDSQIVLAWLATEVTKLQAYVANRVQVIKKNTTDFTWCYVNSKENPADYISRGVDPRELSGCSMWWNGPEFLLQSEYHFAKKISFPIDLPEMKNSAASSVVVSLLMQTQNNVFDFIYKFSKLNKIIRVMAYVLRFCNNIKSNNVKSLGALSITELQYALSTILKHEQGIHFKNELCALNKECNVVGPLKSLHPFLDQTGVMRVGGRLQNSDLPYSQKHPVILPKHSRITELIIHNEHNRLLHAGPRLILSSLNQIYWLVNGIRQIKKVTHKCLKCFRLKAVATRQLMVSLPKQRVTAARAFQVVGIDYAGPVELKNSRVRRAIVSKGYVCVFVCFITKAIHLELVSDMSTDAFLACFKRFVSRRGLPTEVYCDNGSNFIGAKNQLAELYKLNRHEEHQTQVLDFSAQQGIKFHFTPSYSPVFAGLAEAGVKSMKYHLKRIVQKLMLTYEQYITVLTQIEAVLNSRPLLPVSSSDVNDFSYITPGHFLIGTALTSYPEQNITDVPTNRLGFWQKCNYLKQSFWKVWHTQYLNILQCRPKWRNDMPNVNVGTLVILKEPGAPPMYWPMARVVKVFPGNDNLVRAFEVKTSSGKTYRRSLSGICVLPIEDK